jgi:hypothetical protein
MALEKEKYETQILSPCPQYQLKSESKRYDEIIASVDSDLLPMRGSDGQAEVFDINMKKLREYLDEISTGSNLLDGDDKYNIAERVRELKSTTTL